MIHHVFYYVKDNVMTPPKKPVAPLKSKKYQEMMESLDRVVVSASEQQQLALIEPNFDMESSLLGVLVEEGAL